MINKTDITGIKSVDFKISALGYGVVNWNGPTTLDSMIKGKRKTLNNHTLPKLRGYTNVELRKNKSEVEYQGYKLVEQIDLTSTPLYISQNCIRYHLFKDDVINWQHQNIHENVDAILCSMTGLLRGYVIPTNENKRTSPLLLTDFVEQNGYGNYEQFGRAGSKDTQENKLGQDKSNSLFSKTTFGDTTYEAYGSINIEQLQFISLSDAFGQEAIAITTDQEGKKLATKIENFIKQLATTQPDDIKAEYHPLWVRKGTILAQGQKGILLNEAALDVLVNTMLDMIKALSFTQAKGYMYVDTIVIDYNTFIHPRDMFRIKRDISKISIIKKTPYAIYFEKE